jgi:putative protein-disulfide isomerase
MTETMDASNLLSILTIAFFQLSAATTALSAPLPTDTLNPTDMPTLIYIGDPMCSWCYGFSPELTEALDSLQSELKLQLIMGGLRPYNTETMADLDNFLKGHWEEVHQASGQPFNYEILENKTFIYDTEPPSRAVVVARKLKPEVEFAFFKAIQQAFYLDNQNTNELDTYLDLAVRFGIDRKAFAEAFTSEEMEKSVQDDFKQAGQLGIQSFPSLLLLHQGKYYLIGRGYQKASTIVEKVKKVIN